MSSALERTRSYCRVKLLPSRTTLSAGGSLGCPLVQWTVETPFGRNNTPRGARYGRTPPTGVHGWAECTPPLSLNHTRIAVHLRLWRGFYLCARAAGAQEVYCNAVVQVPRDT